LSTPCRHKIITARCIFAIIVSHSHSRVVDACTAIRVNARATHVQSSFPSTAVCGGRHIILDHLFPIPNPARRPAHFLRTRFPLHQARSTSLVHWTCARFAANPMHLCIHASSSPASSPMHSRPQRKHNPLHRTPPALPLCPTQRLLCSLPSY
jgi:hypothetical protein